MNDNRNMLLAIALSALVLIGWSLLSDRFFPTSGPQTQQVENGKVKPAPQPEAAPATAAPQPIRDRAVVLAETPRVKIDTPRLQGSINLKGGRIDDVPLAHRHEVEEARWLPLDEAPRLLAYKGEKEMAEKALMMLAAGGST